MASLDIFDKGNGNYLFTARGCPLKYFVIWAEGDKPRWERVDFGYDNVYRLNYTLDSNTTYNFHVYNGRTSDDFRGKMTYTTDDDYY